ncbi:MAG: T9SS type A sorting domain-containing protein, partial [Caldisericaceae bacterium]|nr:T9SS type A sorting domain-containing protein [Caldisericaceae bacterium]
PFNKQSIILFHLNNMEKVTLTVFNISGKEVIKLINQQMLNAGEHRIMWDGKDMNGKEVSSGVYLYHLKSGQFSQIKKMLLIR